MTKGEIKKLSNNKLDKAVKIQGTNYDRKRKVTKQIRYRMIQMLNAGKSVNTVAEHFGVTPHTVKYNCDEEYNAYVKAYRKKAKNYKHYGTFQSTEERSNYKRNLLESRKDVILFT